MHKIVKKKRIRIEKEKPNKKIRSSVNTGDNNKKPYDNRRITGMPSVEKRAALIFHMYHWKMHFMNKGSIIFKKLNLINYFVLIKHVIHF